jgi:hypothetical protein
VVDGGGLSYDYDSTTNLWIGYLCGQLMRK